MSTNIPTYSLPHALIIRKYIYISYCLFQSRDYQFYLFIVLDIDKKFPLKSTNLIKVTHV